MNRYSGWAMELGVSGWSAIKHKDFTPAALCLVREGIVWLVGKL